MRAIILAAGMGKRLGSLTKENTKCMVNVLQVPLIERLICQLINHSIFEITIVTGHGAGELESFLISKFQHNKKVTFEFIFNKSFASTNNIFSLSLARHRLKTEDVLLFESDLIFDEGIITNILKEPSPNIVCVAKFESWMDGTVVTLSDNSHIESFVPKSDFVFENRDVYYKTVNIYKFSQAFSNQYYIPFLDAYMTAVGKSQYYEDVLKVIASLDKSSLKAHVLNDEKWYEIDDIQDLDIAETIFAETGEKNILLHKRYGGFWRFPTLLDYAYLVNPFFPSKRMVKELAANFEVLLRNYPSGSRVNNLLAAKLFGISEQRIVVGNGAAELISVLLSLEKKRTGVILPTFEEYTNRIDKDLLKTFSPDHQNFWVTTKEILELSSQVERLILVNPNNPNGQLIPVDDLKTIISAHAGRDKQIIVDESFVDFSKDGEKISLFHDDYLRANPHLILIKSISKSYGVPGLRLGVLASGDEPLILTIKSKLPVWNINSFAEFFMQIFGKYEASYRQSCHQFILERERFFDLLSDVTYIRPIPSEANYILCEVLEPLDSKILSQKLLSDNILIKDCSQKKGFENKSYVRLAIRSQNENTYLWSCLKKYENEQ